MIWQQFLQDSAGNYSSARLVNVVVCFAAVVISFALTYTGKMTEAYFAALLAYGAGVQSYGKFVESRKPKE